MDLAEFIRKLQWTLEDEGSVGVWLDKACTQQPAPWMNGRQLVLEPFQPSVQNMCMDKNSSMHGWEDRAPSEDCCKKCKDDSFALAEERISKSAGYIAKALNLLEAATGDIRLACDSQGWNDEVCYQVEDAAKSLGFALATLHRWNDEARES